MPENKKRSGCGCGGCLLFSFYSIIILLGGMYLSNLVDNGWDFDKAKDELIKESKTIAYSVKDTATEIITGEEATKPIQPGINKVPANQDSAPKTLIESADASYAKAMVLLKTARKTTGTERQKILRDLHSELQSALSKYQKAEENDSGNPDLLKKISHISDLLDKMNP